MRVSEVISAGQVFRVVARFARAHPLLQILTGASLWAPICVLLQLTLEFTGYAHPVSSVTGGWGVRITAIGLAGLMGFVVVGFATWRRRRRFRANLVKARSDRVNREKQLAKEKREEGLAEDARMLGITETSIADMTEVMRSVLRRFVDGQRMSIEFTADPDTLDAIERLEGLGWISAHVEYRGARIWMSEDTFALLLRNPALVASNANPTRRRWDLGH